FATVCALMIILAGAVSIPTLPIAQFPALAPPQVTVLSNYIGASAQVVETAVTIPLEQQLNGGQGLKYLTSSSGNGGTHWSVADVFIFGERRYAMRLWLDPVRVASRGLSASDVVAALREQNVQVAAGQVGQQPAPTGQSLQVSVRAVGRLSEPSEFENIIVKAAGDTTVRLKDVGRVELGAEDYASTLQFNGHDAIGI